MQQIYALTMDGLFELTKRRDLRSQEVYALVDHFTINQQIFIDKKFTLSSVSVLIYLSRIFF